MKLQASSYYRDSHCPGGWQLQEQLAPVKRITSPAAARGTEMHQRAEELLKTGAKVKSSDDPIVAYYVKYVRARAKKFKGSIRVEVKDRRTVVGVDCVAIADAVIESPGVIEVVDFKTGNWDYRGSVLHQLYFTAAVLFPDTDKDFIFTVVQPGYFEESLRHYSWGPERVPDLPHMVQEVLVRGAEFVSGAHCTFCPVAVACPVNQNYLEAVHQMANAFPAVTELSTTQLEKLFLAEKTITGYLESAKTVLMDRIQAGERTGRVGLKEKSGRRGWIDEAAAEAALEYLGDDRYERKLKSPTQMEKIAGKKNIEGLTEAPRTWYLAQIANEFKEITE